MVACCGKRGATRHTPDVAGCGGVWIVRGSLLCTWQPRRWCVHCTAGNLTQVWLGAIFAAMQIDKIVCSENVADKLVSKHSVKCTEAEEVLLINQEFVLQRKGTQKAMMCMLLLDKHSQADSYLCSLFTN